MLSRVSYAQHAGFDTPARSQIMTTLPIFSTVAEARAAIDHDKLATVYHRADSVFVATAHGTGTFSRHDWDARPDAPPAPSAPPDCLPFRRQE